MHDLPSKQAHTRQDAPEETSLRYVKPALKPLGDWHIVVRSSNDSEVERNNFFEFDTF